MKSNKRGLYQQQKRPTTNKEPCFVASYGTLSFPVLPWNWNKIYDARQTCLDLLQMVMVTNHMGSESVKITKQTNPSVSNKITRNQTKPQSCDFLRLCSLVTPGKKTFVTPRKLVHIRNAIFGLRCNLAVFWMLFNGRKSRLEAENTRWATKKTGVRYFPLNPGWCIGILIIAYYNPYIIG